MWNWENDNRDETGYTAKVKQPVTLAQQSSLFAIMMGKNWPVDILHCTLATLEIKQLLW